MRERERKREEAGCPAREHNTRWRFFFSLPLFLSRSSQPHFSRLVSFFFALSLALSRFIIVLDVAVEREVEGDVMVQDMGAGVPFRPGTFDGVIR